MIPSTDVGLKILAAIVFRVIGRWLISLLLNMLRASLERRKVNPTVLRYLDSVIMVALNVLLVVGVLGYFVIQTTTFAALIAADKGGCLCDGGGGYWHGYRIGIIHDDPAYAR